MRTSSICIEEASCLRGPADIPQILPRVVEWIVPAAWSHLVPPLRICNWAPYPANTGVAGSIEILGRSNVHTARANIEGQLSHVTVNRLDLFRLAKLRKTKTSTPRLFA